MSDSSENLSEPMWIPFNERPEWADVQPIEQDDGPADVVRIAYTDRFKQTYDYFRAVYASKEVTERAFHLTAEALELNPANYTVWHHRRFLLKAMNIPVEDEYAYIRGVIETYPKNYQVWQHRRALVEWSQDPSKELRLTEITLSQDAKNYHAWQHRQWVMQTFDLFHGELDYVHRLLEEDVRNNSAWNQRFFVIKSTNKEITGDALSSEVEYAMKAIEGVTGNESAWNYLTGLLNFCPDGDKADARNKVLEFCKRLYNEKNCRSVYLMATMVDLLKSSDSEGAVKLCDDLAQEYDAVRKSYWSYIKKTIVNRAGCTECA